MRVTNELSHSKASKFFYEGDGLLHWKRVDTLNQIKPGMPAGYVSDTGYMRVTLEGKSYYVHRILWTLRNHVEPKGYIDHVNHIRTDNRPENLRQVSKLTNARNRSINSNNKSGFRGVGWHKGKQAWQARITVNTRLIHLGTFNKLNEAISARLSAEKRYGFHKNHGASNG